MRSPFNCRNGQAVWIIGFSPTLADTLTCRVPTRQEECAHHGQDLPLESGWRQSGLTSGSSSVPCCPKKWKDDNPVIRRG